MQNRQDFHNYIVKMRYNSQLQRRNEKVNKVLVYERITQLRQFYRKDRIREKEGTVNNEKYSDKVHKSCLC